MESVFSRFKRSCGERVSSVRRENMVREIKFQIIVLNMMLNGIDMYQVVSRMVVGGKGVVGEVMTGG